MRTMIRVLGVMGAVGLLVPACAGEAEVLDEVAEATRELDDEPPPDDMAGWLANMFANQASAMSSVCSPLGGYYVSSTARCIMRGFRIGYGPETSFPDCAADGGYWSGSTCWFSSAWGPTVPVNYASTYKITSPGSQDFSPACIAGPNASAICNLVSGTLTYEPTTCGTATPYKCVYTSGRLNNRAAHSYGFESSNCSDIGGLWSDGTPPGILPRCWARGWLPAYADVNSAELSACSFWGGSPNYTTNACWHGVPWPFAPSL